MSLTVDEDEFPDIGGEDTTAPVKNLSTSVDEDAMPILGGEDTVAPI